MNINISRHDLVDETLPAYVDQLLERHGVPHNRITLEVTESALSDDPTRANRSIRQLRRRGVCVSIDDFAVGYSSMSQLLELPIDELKIDKSFVLALQSDHRAQAIVHATIELAHALNLTVVAEGVELVDDLRLLQRLGADIAQGYHIARPLTTDQLDEYLTQPDHDFGLLPRRAITATAAMSSLWS